MLTNAQISDSGARFSCLVSNAAGSITSDSAVLTVVLGNLVTYWKPDLVRINDNAPATPYPSTITIAGLSGRVRKVTVQLHGLSHSFPHDVGILLAGPTGEAIVLLANAGGWEGVTGVDLTFDDAAPTQLDEYSSITSGVYKPSPCGTSEVFPPPAPVGPYATTLFGFKGLNPNGSWSLYVHDDAAGDEGALLHGWSLSLTIDLPLRIIRQPQSQTAIEGQSVVFEVEATGTLPLAYSWQLFGTNLASGTRISGASTLELSLSSVRLTDAGPYDVVVSNASGTVTSVSAVLTVLPAATPYFIPESMRYLPDGEVQCSLAGAPGSNYLIQVSADLRTWKTSEVLSMTNNTSEFLDKTTNRAIRFYRARLAP